MKIRRITRQLKYNALAESKNAYIFILKAWKEVYQQCGTAY